MPRSISILGADHLHEQASHLLASVIARGPANSIASYILAWEDAAWILTFYVITATIISIVGLRFPNSDSRTRTSSGLEHTLEGESQAVPDPAGRGKRTRLGGQL